jgi:predicted aldo/keto reductase-like oxidoreductase
MEPCKGGTLANPPEEAAKLMKDYAPDASLASWAYRWVGSLPGVRVVSVGMPKMEFLDDNMKTFDDFKPLNEEEYTIIDKVVDIINSKTAIPCTNCKYCEEACPFDIPAGDYFQLYNDYYRMTSSTDYNDVITPAVTYSNIIERRTAADKCVACGKCEKVCPQHLKVADLLHEKVVEDMGAHDPNSLVKGMTDKMKVD